MNAASSDQMEVGLALMTERLSTVERAAYVLREGFEYPYHHIATTLRVSDFEARQLVRRSSRKLATVGWQSVRTLRQRHALREFLAAARAGEFVALERLFIHASCVAGEVISE